MLGIMFGNHSERSLQNDRVVQPNVVNSGLVISGPRSILLSLPLPERTLQIIQSDTNDYCSVNVTKTTYMKMSLIHHFEHNQGKLVYSDFTNNTDSDGSYTIHKYIWFIAP